MGLQRSLRLNEVVEFRICSGDMVDGYNYGNGDGDRTELLAFMRQENV
jgi:hypothetical protein